jgi:ABC-type Fe3+-hydroxamate transport system substrate-binding protein
VTFPLATPDALGRPVRLEAPPRRIVSLVPSQTELLADLGLGDEVVGITRFCVHPPSWKGRKTGVGGTKDVRVERVRALAPDLVLANREENVREQVEALATFAPVYVTDVASVDDALAMICVVGRLVDRVGAADALAVEIRASFGRLAAAEPVRAAYLIWREPWMTVGRDTIIHDVMARGGLANVFGDRTRYPAVTPDDLRAARPEVVLLSSEPYPFKAKHVAEVEAMAPGVPVLLVDGEPFSWYGSRLRETPAALAALRGRLAALAA